MIPIVFVGVSDPIGEGFVASLPHPSGNLTGFINFESSLASKWLELLTQIAPGAKRVGIMFNPKQAPGGGLHFLPSFEAAAPAFGVELIAAPVDSDAEIERAITSLGHGPGGGLILPPDIFTLTRRAEIILLAARYNLPTVYSNPYLARDGGLLSYGPDPTDLFRRAATYVDRILRGAKPADLPVQLPAKFDLLINLKTAKALGLTIPPNLVALADEVIE